MDKEILKSALFGYSKISVCQYIATMNEEFNAKLMTEEASFRDERTKLQKKIDELEAELAVHKQNACDVGLIILTFLSGYDFSKYFLILSRCSL